MKIPTRKLTYSCALVLSANPFQATLAQENTLVLEEVIVTAQKRAESLQDVPVSVSAVSGDKIIEQGIADLTDMSAYVPNLTINQTPGATQVFIRGLGSGDNSGFEQSVGLFIDGVYAGRARQFRAPFLDIASVEVLRGAQGTLFGKNTIAGAITVNTQRPSNEFEAILRTSYDIEYEDYSVDAILSGPLSDSLSGRLAVRHGDDAGYLDNTALNRGEVDQQETVLRGSILWDASDTTSVFLKYETAESDLQGRSVINDELGGWEPLVRAADPNFTSADDSRSANLDESSDTDSESLTLQIDANLGEFELTAISGYSEYQFDDLVDADTTALDVAAFAPSQDFEQWSQEVRLASPVGGAVDYIIGAYYQESKLNVVRNLGANPANAAGGPGTSPAFATLPSLGFEGEFDQSSDTYALFGSLTWHPSDRLHVNVGLRYTNESKDAQRSLFYTGYLNSIPIDVVYDPITDPLRNLTSRSALQFLGLFEHDIASDRQVDDWSPTLRISYDLTDDIMLYASTSTAFKSGGFNEAGSRGDDPGEFPANGAPANFEFDDEEALSFEIGGKMRLLDQRASLNFAVFRTEFDNLQVSTFQGDSFVVGNAADAISQGIEIDGVVLLSQAWTLSGSLAYLDAEYDNFKTAPCTVSQEAAFEQGGGSTGGCQQDLSGADLPNAPDWSGVLSLEYNRMLQDLSLSAKADVVYTGEQYLAGDLDPVTREDANTLLNARLALASQDERWEVAIVGNNLTNETVRTFTNDPFLLDGVFFSHVAPPRTIELHLNLRW